MALFVSGSLTEPSSVLVTYTITDGDGKKQDCLSFESIAQGKTISELWSDCVQAITVKEGL
jgi:hypothetical protein